ncbi:LytTR family DNA-binding domain-containing protein [Polaribacter sp. MED152]|uniref:LytR/AlgR family response regulator transcription factor n=1 Tax=Polaribacter sp. MED152 TaxID=313598 RepID=UPI0000689A73|nr:LytTR family DNA-binding domain-containing protein [Polaribacter sp. MED152]EAQ41024.1 transcriptional regulator, LytTr family [Polaribacter sp. MED152]
MKKDKLYLFTFLSIALIFLLGAIFISQFLIKASAKQLIKVQVESAKREANEIADFLSFQLDNKISKQESLERIQENLSNNATDTWFISVFNWSGNEVANPNKLKVGQPLNSNEKLLASLIGKNYSDEFYDILKSSKEIESEVIYISPVKNSDLIVAANVNIKNVRAQFSGLKSDFYLTFFIMGILITLLTFIVVRYLGSAYEKQLETKYASLTSEVINLSKLNADLISYKERVVEEPVEITSDDNTEQEKKRILTYIRNELVPIAISDIAYVYTENTITYVVCFDGKKSTTNMSLDDMYNNFDATLFFRANRQFIISIAAIDKIIKYGKSQLKILLQSKTSEEIIISKNKAAEFKQWLNM